MEADDGPSNGQKVVGFMNLTVALNKIRPGFEDFRQVHT